MGFWQGRRVLITGGAGFIGSHLAVRLLELGSRVRIADSLERMWEGRPSVESWKDDVDFQRFNLCDPEACRRACQSCEIVFHFAARAGSFGYYQKHPGRVLCENVLLDTQLLQAALAAKVNAYFYPSSSMVYPLERQQSPDAPPLREEDVLPAHPPNSYGWAKLVGERAVEYTVQECTTFRAAILRLENVYGPGQDIDFERGSLIPVLARRVLEYPRTSFFLRGTGQETRCYCYISDALDAILRSVEQLEKQPLVGPLNVTGRERTGMLDLAHEIIQLSGKEVDLRFVPGETLVWGQVLDCSKVQLQLGWVPLVPLRTGLQQVLADVETRLPRGSCVAG